MTDTNVNLSNEELRRLELGRIAYRLARKMIRKRRYLRQYMRRGGFTRALMVRVSDIVTITIGPLSAVTYPLDSLGLV
jgi:hypothetical protein